MSLINFLWSTEGFPPRWLCGQWPNWLGWLHIISDILIWGAYFAIPFLLWRFIKQQKNTPFPQVFLLFCLFIFSCGLTHLVEVAIFWWPIYRFGGILKLITALASWVTVFALINILPKAAQLKSVNDMEAIIEARTAELQESVEHSKGLVEFTRLANRISEYGYEKNDFDKTLHFTLKQLRSALLWDVGHIYNYDATQKIHESSGLWSYDTRKKHHYDTLIQVSETMPIPKGEGLVGNTAVLGEIRWVEKIAYDTPYVLGNRLKPGNITSFLGIPIIVNNNVIAVLEFLNPTAKPVDDDVIEYLKLIQTTLRRFKERLDANEERQTYITTLTHDMKTPLKSEIYLCQKLLDGHYGELPEKPKHLIQDIKQSSSYMLNMIENVLTNFKHGQQAITITPEPIELVSFIQHICQHDINGLIEERQHALHTDLPLTPIPIQADPQSLRRILFNLLQNAIDYTPQNGDLTISVSERNNVVTIAIEDSGPGVPVELQPTLFSTTTTAKKPRYRGTGLGLFVCKKLVSAHGGHIQYTPASGKNGCHGACFTIKLPKST